MARFFRVVMVLDVDTGILGEAEGIRRPTDAEVISEIDTDMPVVISDGFRNTKLTYMTVEPTELTPWMDIDVWSLRGRNTAERLERGSAEHLAAMREYLRTGGISDCYLDDPAGYGDESEDLDALADAGERVEDIDWTGIDTARGTDEDPA